MSLIRQVRTKPEIAIIYIVDKRKLDTVPSLRELFGAVKDLLTTFPWNSTELGPVISVDEIANYGLSIKGRFDGVLGITFTGTSAKQTAVLGYFGGPVAVWFFPESEWWSMASAGSGIGYIRDEAEVNPNVSLYPIYGQPEDVKVQNKLEIWSKAVHTLHAMRREKIGLVGGAYTEVMPASNWHPDILTSRLGPQYVDLSMTELIKLHKGVKENEIDELIQELKEKGFRIDEDEKSLSKIRKAAAASLALEKLQIRENLTGVAINCYGGSDPERYTGILGNLGTNACLKGHALSSVIIGCESDVVQTAQQMIFRHLVDKIPSMADPWKVKTENNFMIAGTCSAPFSPLDAPANGKIKAGTLMSLYKVGVLGVAVPTYQPGDVIVARISGRELDKMVLATGKFLRSSFEIIPGRVAFEVQLRKIEKWLGIGCLGNHYTFLPTDTLEMDLAKLKLYCEFNGIKIIDCD